MANVIPSSEGRPLFVEKDGVADYMAYRAELLAGAGYETTVIGGPNPTANGQEQIFNLPGKLTVATYQNPEAVLAGLKHTLTKTGTTVTNVGDIWKMIANPQKPNPEAFKSFIEIMQDHPLVWDTHNIHSVDGFPYPDLLSVFVDRFSEQNKGLLVAGSRRVMQEALDVGIPENRVRQVYPAIDTAIVNEIKKENHADVRNRLGLNPDEAYLACVSRVAPGKNIQQILGAWKEMQADRFDNDGNINPDNLVNKAYGNKKLNLILIGGASEGEDQEKYEQWVADANNVGRDHSRNSVITMGEMRDDKRIAEYTYAADGYILPSQLEGYNLTVLRALALEKSTIALKFAQENSGVGELIVPGKTGTVFEEFTGESLSRAVYDAEEQKQQFAENGLVHINSGGRLLNHEQATETMLGIYNEVTSERPFSIAVLAPPQEI